MHKKKYFLGYNSRSFLPLFPPARPPALSSRFFLPVSTEGAGVEICLHPLHPSTLATISQDVRHRCNGLGPSTFATVPDEALVHTFLFLLDAATLARLSRCSRAWYCYAHAYTDVWKSLVLTSLAER